jgi:integrase
MPTGSRPVTLRQYAKRWNIERAAAGIADAPNELTRLRLHAFPAIIEGRELGDYLLGDVRRAHVKELARKLRASAKLSPRSKYHVYNSLHLLFAEAIDEERVDVNPCSLDREKYLGPKVDADPEWRRGAVFTACELASLLYDPRINPARQVFYALLFLTGARLGEVFALRWRHLDLARKPLGEILVAHSHGRSRTKTAVVRRVPIHPVLASILAAWKLGGWANLLGKDRGPGPDDLVIPTEQGSMRKQQNAWDYLQRDLDRIGSRVRRLHDARRTFISLARAGGANVDLLRVVTHGLRQREIVDLYTDEDSLWSGVCAEVVKLRVARPGTSVSDGAAG